MSLDLVCFSHLRWDFVYQRPNHLMSRAARDRRVFFIEEPVIAEDSSYRVQHRENVAIITPSIRAGLDAPTSRTALRAFIDTVVRQYAIEAPVLW